MLKIVPKFIFLIFIIHFLDLSVVIRVYGVFNFINFNTHSKYEWLSCLNFEYFALPVTKLSLNRKMFIQKYMNYF